LERRLRGDLDTVVLTALRIEPEQRYESAAQLAADIRRSEEQLPITARAPTLAYTARKFLARHTAAVTAAAVAVLALVATAGVATYYGVTTERQSRTIIQERDRAEQTQKFLLSIFEEADPNEARGAEITAKELLGRGAQRIDEELAGQPDVQAILKATIGHVYVVLGLYHEARPQLEDAAAFFRSAQGETSAAYAEVLDQLAELAEIEGDYPAALALAERALEASEKAGDPAGIARDSTRTGRVLHLMGKLDEAEAHYQRGLDIYIGLYGENNAAVAQSLSHFGGLMTHLNRLDEAESLHRRSLMISRALHGDDHLASIESMINLGWVLNKQEKYEQALAMLNNALALNLRLLGPDHRDNSFIYNHRAHAQKGLGNYAAAEADFLRSRDIVEQQLGRSHPNYGIATGNIGKMLVIQEDFVGAEPYLREAREVLSTALPDHWMTHDIEFRLGTTLSELDRYADAEVYLRASVTGLSDKRGQYGDIIREATASLIEVLELQNKTSEAERYRTLLNDTEHRAEKNSAADAPGPLN
ncbi:MAG: tetratricopeptide repeat protein, partial [Gammaproteobacteria bacterium]